MVKPRAAKLEIARALNQGLGFREERPKANTFATPFLVFAPEGSYPTAEVSQQPESILKGFEALPKRAFFKEPWLLFVISTLANTTCSL